MVSDILEALLKPGRVADIHPEHLCLRRLFGGAIAVLNSKLRLSVPGDRSEHSITIPLAYPTPPKPTSAIRDAGVEYFLRI